MDFPSRKPPQLQKMQNTPRNVHGADARIPARGHSAAHTSREYLDEVPTGFDSDTGRSSYGDYRRPIQKGVFPGIQEKSAEESKGIRPEGPSERRRITGLEAHVINEGIRQERQCPVACERRVCGSGVAEGLGFHRKESTERSVEEHENPTASVVNETTSGNRSSSRGYDLYRRGHSPLASRSSMSRGVSPAVLRRDPDRSAWEARIQPEDRVPVRQANLAARSYGMEQEDNRARDFGNTSYDKAIERSWSCTRSSQSSEIISTMAGISRPNQSVPRGRSYIEERSTASSGLEASYKRRTTDTEKAAGEDRPSRNVLDRMFCGISNKRGIAKQGGSSRMNRLESDTKERADRTSRVRDRRMIFRGAELMKKKDVAKQSPFGELSNRESYANRMPDNCLQSYVSETAASQRRTRPQTTKLTAGGLSQSRVQRVSPWCPRSRDRKLPDSDREDPSASRNDERTMLSPIPTEPEIRTSSNCGRATAARFFSVRRKNPSVSQADNSNVVSSKRAPKVVMKRRKKTTENVHVQSPLKRARIDPLDAAKRRDCGHPSYFTPHRGDRSFDSCITSSKTRFKKAKGQPGRERKSDPSALKRRAERPYGTLKTVTPDKPHIQEEEDSDSDVVVIEPDIRRPERDDSPAITVINGAPERDWSASCKDYQPGTDYAEKTDSGYCTPGDVRAGSSDVLPRGWQYLTYRIAAPDSLPPPLPLPSYAALAASSTPLHHRGNDVSERLSLLPVDQQSTPNYPGPERGFYFPPWIVVPVPSRGCRAPGEATAPSTGMWWSHEDRGIPFASACSSGLAPVEASPDQPEQLRDPPVPPEDPAPAVESERPFETQGVSGVRDYVTTSDTPGLEVSVFGQISGNRNIPLLDYGTKSCNEQLRETAEGTSRSPLMVYERRSGPVNLDIISPISSANSGSPVVVPDPQGPFAVPDPQGPCHPQGGSHDGGEAGGSEALAVADERMRIAEILLNLGPSETGASEAQREDTSPQQLDTTNCRVNPLVYDDVPETPPQLEKYGELENEPVATSENQDFAPRPSLVRILVRNGNDSWSVKPPQTADNGNSVPSLSDGTPALGPSVPADDICDVSWCENAERGSEAATETERSPFRGDVETAVNTENSSSRKSSQRKGMKSIAPPDACGRGVTPREESRNESEMEENQSGSEIYVTVGMAVSGMTDAPTAPADEVRSQLKSLATGLAGTLTSDLTTSSNGTSSKPDSVTLRSHEFGKGVSIASVISFQNNPPSEPSMCSHTSILGENSPFSAISSVPATGDTGADQSQFEELGRGAQISEVAPYSPAAVEAGAEAVCSDPDRGRGANFPHRSSSCQTDEASKLQCVSTDTGDRQNVNKCTSVAERSGTMPVTAPEPPGKKAPKTRNRPGPQRLAKRGGAHVVRLQPHSAQADTSHSDVLQLGSLDACQPPENSDSPSKCTTSSETPSEEAAPAAVQLVRSGGPPVSVNNVPSTSAPVGPAQCFRVCSETSCLYPPNSEPNPSYGINFPLTTLHETQFYSSPLQQDLRVGPQVLPVQYADRPFQFPANHIYYASARDPLRLLMLPPSLHTQGLRFQYPGVLPEYAQVTCSESPPVQQNQTSNAPQYPGHAEQPVSPEYVQVTCSESPPVQQNQTSNAPQYPGHAEQPVLPEYAQVTCSESPPVQQNQTSNAPQYPGHAEHPWSA